MTRFTADPAMFPRTRLIALFSVAALVTLLLVGADQVTGLQVDAPTGKDDKAAADKKAIDRREPEKNNGRPASRRDDRPKAPTEKEFLGVGACAKCHEAPSRRDDTSFCALTESTTWEKQDKHSQAFAVLLNARSKEMGKRLGIADVSKDNACLACHAVVVDQSKQGRGFRIEDGVSCDACHGPSNAWVDEHWRNRDWRSGIDPLTKEREFGFLNVRDARRRAALCASCHVGNVSEGKFVTHAMFAAGHPPLPSFEIDTFAEVEPRHWRLLKEKDPKVQEEFRYDSKQNERVQKSIVGGVIALREAALALAAGADRTSQSPLDLAHFDCAACHHELATTSWRQTRPKALGLGRPMPRVWPTFLPMLALVALNRPASELDQALEPIQAAFAEQPFGKSSAIAPAAKNLAGWCDQVADALMKVRFDRPLVLKLLRETARRASQQNLDFESARQAGWVVLMLAKEAGFSPGELSKVTPSLTALEAALALKLPAGVQYKIEEQMPRALSLAANDDPAAIRPLFANVLAALPN